jgi:prefoldin beta subunit
MAEPIRDPKKLQMQIDQIQNVQRQMQVLGVQKQQIQLQIEELKLAKDALKDADGEIYKAAGNLLIQTDKPKAKKEVDERIEVFEVRQKTVAKQEEKLREMFESLRKEIEKETAEPG